MKKIFSLVVLILCISIYKSTYGTHLIGGNLGYEYIGQTPTGEYTFKIILTTYTNCGPGSNVPSPENDVTVAIYNHDVQNSPLGGVDKSFIQTLFMPLVNSFIIQPGLPNGCTVGSSSCIYKGVYEATVDLPLNFTGYHVFYERCCRNNSIVNLVPQESMSFHAYISPPLLGNSSPIFTDDPVPFLCAGDTTTILNTAIDPDGDELVFSFVVPYDADQSSAADPDPISGGNIPIPLQWPIAPVTYETGYSLADPFGTGGYTSINASTGLTTYFPPATGDYVVAVEIKEYRNGNLIGVTRRDLQLLVINCPPNPAPNIDPQAGTTQFQFTVEEGETLCFDFGFDDPNGDSLTLTVNGQIFDPLFVNPPATINSPVTGVDTVSTQFCWTTSCGQSQALPYQFQVSAEDRGCPPKTTNEVFQITVTEVPPPDTIIGIDVICQFLTETYSTQTLPNTTYDWSVTNGVITQNNGSSVDIQWTGVGTGTVSLSATNQYGCSSVPITKNVTITPAPITEAGNDTTICFGDTIQLTGTTNASPGFTALWTPTDSITGNTTLTPLVFPSDTITYTITIDIGGGCFGFDSVKVNVNIPQIDAGSDTTICEGESVQLNGSSSNGTITWSPAATLSDPTVYDPIATPTLSTNYLLELIDPVGCTLIDSVRVNVDAPVSLTISNDTTICFGDCANLLVTGANNNAWETSTSLNDTSIANPTACPSSTETFTVYGSTGACADTAQVTVTVNTLPTIDAGTDPTICFGDTTNLSAVGAIDYSWSPADSLSSSIISNPQAWPSDTTQYVVTGTDINSCSNTDTVTVNVNPLPNVDAGNNTTICTGDSIQLNATGAATYIWSPVTDLSNPTVADPFASPSTPTTYTVTGTDINGCVNVDSITISLHSLPTATVSNDTTICIGDTAQLIASGGTNYTWSPADSLSSTVISNPLAWPTVTTNYQVIISDNNGCLDTAQVNVTISNLPNVDAGSDVDICFGDTVQLNASGADTYSWSPADSLNNTGIANPQAWPSDTTEYIVTGLNNLGCLNTDTLFVNVNPLPPADAGPDTWICPGDNIQLSASGGAVYLWTPAANLSDPNIADPVVTLTDTASYQVLVTSAEGCTATDSITIFVNPNVPTDAGADTTICIGDSLQIGGNPTAVNGTSYLWSPAGFVDDPTLANPIAFPTTPTMFYVVTSNDTCTGIDSVFIGVNPTPAIDAGADLQICLGDTAQLNASGGISYVWSPIESAPGDTILSNDTIADPLAFPTDTTLFFVSIEDLNGCVDTDSVTVIVNPPPSVDAGSNTGICIGDSIQLGAVGGDIYVWTPADSISDVNIADPMVWPSDTTEYFVSVTDSNGCINNDSLVITVHPLPNVSAGVDDTICIGQTTQLIGTGALTYLWSPNDSISDNTVAFPFVWPTDTTDYIVVGTDANGCVQSDTVNILVNPLPIVTASSDVQICIGDSTQLSATGADSYVWTPNNSLVNAVVADPIALPTDTTEYIVQGVDLNGCVNTDTVLVNVNPLPDADAGFNVNICEGDNVLLGATGGVSYQWSPANFLNHDTVADPLAFPDTSMVFYVEVTDSNGCVASDSMGVTVFMIYTVDDQTICLGDSVQLNVFGEPAVSFSWSPATDLSDPNIIDPWASPSSTTTYTVTATDSQGCTDQDDATVIISSDPASFTTEVVGGCEGAVASFTNTSDPALDFVWYFSDGDTSTLEEVDHVYTFGEDFSAILTVTNELGCIDSATFNGTALNFEDYYDIQIPNVFTPNGDGQNDHFVVEVPGRIYECVDLKIYNRWGQILFISTGNNLKWDGRTSVGEKVPSGTYFYTIDVKGNSYNGSIYLFR